MRNKIGFVIVCLIAFFQVNVFAQGIHVTGQVLDATDFGIPGVNVVIKGNTNTGTITDVDGNFSIMVPSNKTVLSFSFMGYKAKEVSVNGNKTLKVLLDEDTQLIDEVVVVGYGTQRKGNVSGAIQSIDSKILASRPITSAVQGLQGAVAGLNITNDMGGAPGQKMEINIRGIGSIDEGSSAKPLVLIDGMEGDLSVVNPYDIENIVVLKDAAAASIYGSRAPYGVVLVTLKKGEKGLRISYSGNVRISQPINTPTPVNSYQYAMAVNDAFTNAGDGVQINQIDKILAYQNGVQQIGDENIGWGIGMSKPDPVTGEYSWQGDQSCWADTNWYDVHLKKASYSQEHNLNLSGGGDAYKYFISGRYMNQNGMFRYSDDNYQNFSLNGNFTMNVNKYVTVDWSTRLVLDESSKPSMMDDYFFHNLGRTMPLIPLNLPNGEFHPNSLIPALQNGGKTISGNNALYNQGKLTIEPIKDWKIYVDFSSRIESPKNSKQFKKVYSTQADGRVSNIQLIKDVAVRHEVNKDGGFRVQPAAGESYYETGFGKVNSWSFSARTDYEKKLKRHFFKVLAGTQVEYYSTEMSRTGCSVVVSDENPWIVNDPSNLTSETKGEWSNIGLFARLNYSWADRYLLELNFRADAASRFPSNQRWGYFPSFSAGWNIAQEPFFANLQEKGWEMFKIRASFGTLGNQNTTSFYPYFQKMTATTIDYVFLGDKVNGLKAPDPFSRNITWEKIQTTDFGVDLAFLSSRLEISADWYERLTKDMVGPASAVPNVFGAKIPLTNNAELQTRGWEVEVKWADRVNKNVSYEVAVSMSDFKSIVTKYDSPDGKLSGYYKGKVLGDIWGLKVKGIAQSDKEMSEYLAVHSQKSIGGDTWGGGDFMFQNLDDDPSINKGAQTIYSYGDLTKIGNETPRYSYGVRGRVTYKDFDFSMFWQGVGKRDVYIGSATFFGMQAGYDRSLYVDHMDYFRYAGHPLGANLDPYYARIRKDTYNTQTNDRYLQDGSYLRLKNLTLGYTLPQNTSAQKYIKTLRIFVSAENLFTFTKLMILDPEALGTTTQAQGIGKTYPMNRTFSVGLSIML